MVGSIDKFQREMVQQVEDDKFEAFLTLNTDVLPEEPDIRSQWACVNCHTLMPIDQSTCKACAACRTHGEPDCRVCKKPPVPC